MKKTPFFKITPAWKALAEETENTKNPVTWIYLNKQFAGQRPLQAAAKKLFTKKLGGICSQKKALAVSNAIQAGLVPEILNPEVLKTLELAGHKKLFKKLEKLALNFAE